MTGGKGKAYTSSCRSFLSGSPRRPFPRLKSGKANRLSWTRVMAAEGARSPVLLWALPELPVLILPWTTGPTFQATHGSLASHSPHLHCVTHVKHCSIHTGWAKYVSAWATLCLRPLLSNRGKCQQVSRAKTMHQDLCTLSPAWGCQVLPESSSPGVVFSKTLSPGTG